MSIAAAVKREHTTAYHVRNIVFFMAVIAMNYTLARPSPVDFLFVTAAALSIFVNQTIRISYLILVILLTIWMSSYTIASIPFLDEPVVGDEMFKKTFVVSLGLIAGYVSSSWGTREYHQFLYVYIFSAFIAASIGIIGFILNIPLVLWDGRAAAFIDDPNMYGSFLLPAVIGCVYLMGNGMGRKWLLIPITLWLMLGVLFSFSRAATVGLSACLIIYIAFLNRGNILRLIAYVTTFVTVAALIFGSAFLIAPNFSNKFFERATVAKSYDLGREGRYARFARSIPMILDNPVGLGIVQQEKIFTEPIHNSFLSSFLNYGWSGGIAWLTIFIGSIGLSIWNYLTTRSPIPILLLFGFLSPVLCTLLHEGEHWRHLWLWMGLVWGFNSWNFVVPMVHRLVPTPLRVTYLPREAIPAR